MAIITCSKCGQKMSDKALQCPHCGSANVQNGSNTENSEEGVKALWVVLDFFVPIVGIILYFLHKPNKATAKAGLIAALISMFLVILAEL